MTRSAVNYLIGVAGESAGLKNVHPHLLRHSCGYYLASTGVDLRTMQDYLGHRDPKHTVHTLALLAGGSRVCGIEPRPRPHHFRFRTKCLEATGR